MPKSKRDDSQANTRAKKPFCDGSAAFRVALILLIFLLLASTAILSVRLYLYAQQDQRALSLKTGMDAQLELFSVSYDGTGGELTVIGANGDEVVAPGTDVEYTLRLRNTDNVALDYDLTPVISFTSEYELPLLIRMLDENNAYLIGDAKTWISPEDLGELHELGTLGKGEAVEYVFQWKWPFESGNDAYDTSLGDHAFGENVEITVSFSVHATANTDVPINGGFVDSGLLDSIAIGALVLLLLVSILLLLFSYIRSHKRKESELTETFDEKQN